MINGKKIKNMDLAARRIRQAVENSERIIIYGDSDLDGVASSIMAGEIVKNLGGKVAAYYFPVRETEGYGITETALEKLKIYAPGLLVAVDLGIGNFREVKTARNLGLSTVIVDHHEILDGVPEADVIVDPKQPGDEYPFKLFAAAGLVFKLAEEVFGHDFCGSLRQSFAELAALATMADMMPREEGNKDIISEGMSTLKMSFRPGIRAFFDTDAFFENDSRNFNNRVNRIITVLNVRDVRNGVPAAFELLTATSLDRSAELIREFLSINELRRKKIDAMVQTVEKRLDPAKSIIFEGDAEWESNLLGTIASILSLKYQRPTFIYKKLETESQGTVRSIDGIDSVALMKKCKDLLITYGGHPKASGFRVKNENLGIFKQRLIENIFAG